MLQKEWNCDSYLPKPVIIEDLCQILFKHLKYSISPAPKDAHNDNDNDNDNDTTNDRIINLPELTRKLSEMIPQWKTITGGAIEIDDTSAFSQQLLKMATDHHCLSLQSYAQELLDSLENFDIELLDSLLSSFPKLVEKVKLT